MSALNLGKSRIEGFDCRWARYECARLGHLWRPNGWSYRQRHLVCKRCGKTTEGQGR